MKALITSLVLLSLPNAALADFDCQALKGGSEVLCNFKSPTDLNSLEGDFEHCQVLPAKPGEGIDLHCLMGGQNVEPSTDSFLKKPVLMRKPEYR